MEVLIVSPMKCERDGVLKGLNLPPGAVSQVRRGLMDILHVDFPLRFTRTPAFCTLFLGIGGHGKVQFGVQTRHLLDNGSKPDLVICMGSSGALHPDVSPGDLVVGTETIEHDYRERFHDSPPPRFLGCERTLGTLRRITRDFPGTVHFGPIASGDEDIVDRGRAEELRSETGALAVAWEGAGGARACAFSRIPFLEIRGISDSANASTPQDYKRNLASCMETAGKLVHLMLKSGTQEG